MNIGNLPKDFYKGASFELNKWYIWLTVLPRSPHRFRVFRPYFIFGFIKIIDSGEPTRLDGRPEKRKGIYKKWEFPIGLSVEINIER